MAGVIRGLAIARRLARPVLYCGVWAAAAAAQAPHEPGVESTARPAQEITAGRAAEPDGYWMGDVDAPTPATIRGGSVIHTADLAALLRQGGTVLVDVSNAPRRPSGLAPGWGFPAPAPGRYPLKPTIFFATAWQRRRPAISTGRW